MGTNETDLVLLIDLHKFLTITKQTRYSELLDMRFGDLGNRLGTWSGLRCVSGTISAYWVPLIAQLKFLRII